MTQLQEWTSVFQQKASELREGDTWSLEFDDSIEPHKPDHGWQQYIRSAAARFGCSSCRRTWPSNRVMVVFHMRLASGVGVVKVRRFRQNCKRCSNAPMEEPDISPENVCTLLENLVKKIRIKCYNEAPKEPPRQFTNYDVKSPHEPTHCEGCIKGICNRDEQTASSFSFQ
ncbi:receptor-transporting protein 3-like [Genypterus blacodes]|uniref:receptor-transporting protein 3-like n=1 Tax=Genypterus blacodes TaxID=154954 RepID=UPI003F75BB8C